MMPAPGREGADGKYTNQTNLDALLLTSMSKLLDRANDFFT
jgi:hypothetical protein